MSGFDDRESPCVKALRLFEGNALDLRNLDNIAGAATGHQGAGPGREDGGGRGGGGHAECPGRRSGDGGGVVDAGGGGEAVALEAGRAGSGGGNSAGSQRGAPQAHQAMRGWKGPLT